MKEIHINESEESIKAFFEENNSLISSENQSNSEISSSKENEEQFKAVKALFDSLENCEKSMVYRDAKHWYIEIS